MKAGFAEINITPPLGTQKIGWLKVIVPTRVVDPLYARAAVFESGKERIGFIQLDTLSIRSSLVRGIRRECEKRFGFPGKNLMIAATHNHGGPAIARVGEKIPDYVSGEQMTEKLVTVFGQALANRETAEIGFGRALNWSLAKNRRVVMRSGIVRTHGTFSDPDALCLEGPIDPEVVVLAARNSQGRLLGLLANYACHPTHNGGDNTFTAGWPGCFANEMKKRGCPVPLFLNGALGNMHHNDPCTDGKSPSMQQCGRSLADSVTTALNRATFRKNVKVRAATKTLHLPFRKITKDEILGTTFGAQRFIDPAIYDRAMKSLVAEIRKEGTQKAEVQALFVDNHAFVSIPAEYFVEDGLAIKERAHSLRTVVVGLANGMVGYVPTRAAFRRGGYETTFLFSSKLAPEAGEMLADVAVNLVNRHR